MCVTIDWKKAKGVKAIQSRLPPRVGSMTGGGEKLWTTELPPLGSEAEWTPGVVIWGAAGAWGLSADEGVDDSDLCFVDPDRLATLRTIDEAESPEDLLETFLDVPGRSDKVESIDCFKLATDVLLFINEGGTTCWSSVLLSVGEITPEQTRGLAPLSPGWYTNKWGR